MVLMTSTPLLTDEHRRMFDFLCQSPRRPGSEHSERVRQWLKSQFESYGLDTAYHEERFVGWDAPEPPFVRFVEPEDFTAECYTVIWSASTKGRVKGILEAAGEMLTFETYPWKRYAVRDDNGQIVLYLLAQPKIYSWVQTLDAPGESVPHVTINAHDKIEAWLSQGKRIMVEAEVKTVFENDAPLVSVCAGNNHKPSVCIAAHYDSVHNGVGAHDNASGIVALLEAAKKAATLPEDICFVAFDGEEMNKVGAYRFVEALRQQGGLDNLRLVINIDSVGIGDKLYVLTSPAIQTQVASALSEFSIDVITRETFKQFDSWPFMKEGINAVQIGAMACDREKTFSFFNSPHDTIGGNGFELSSRFISEASGIAVRLADLTTYECE